MPQTLDPVSETTDFFDKLEKDSVPAPKPTDVEKPFHGSLTLKEQSPEDLINGFFDQQIANAKPDNSDQSLATRVAGKLPKDLSPDEKEEIDNQTDPQKIGELMDNAPQHTLTDAQLKARFDADRAKPITTKVGDFVGGAAKAIVSAIPPLAKGVGKLALDNAAVASDYLLDDGPVIQKDWNGKPLEPITPEQQEALDQPAKNLKAAADDWRSLGSGTIGGVENAELAIGKANAGGSAVTDALKESVGAQDYQTSLDNYIARQRINEAAAADKLARPDRGAAISADFIREHAPADDAERIAQGVESQGIKTDPNIEAVSGLLPTDPTMALLGGAGTLAKVVKPTMAARIAASPAATATLAKVSALPAAIASKVGGLTEKAGDKTFNGVKFVAKDLPEKIGEKILPGFGTTSKVSALTGTALATVGLVPTAKVAATAGALALGGRIARGVGGLVRSVADQAKLGPTRKGLFSAAAAAPESSKLTQQIFGGWRGKTADYLTRRGGYYSFKGAEGAAINTLLGLPQMENAEQFGESFGSGIGMGVAFGTLGHKDAMRHIRRMEENGDIRTMRLNEDPDAQARWDSLTDPNEFQAAMSSHYQQFEDLKNDLLASPEKDTPEVKANIAKIEKTQQTIKDMVEKVSKMTPEQLAEVRRSIDLERADNLSDMVKNVGLKSGLGDNISIHLLDGTEIPDFLDKIYAPKLENANNIISNLSGKTDLTADEKDLLNQAHQTISDHEQLKAEGPHQQGWAIRAEDNPTGKPIVVIERQKILRMLGGNLANVIRHEVLHGLLNFDEVKNAIQPVVDQYFDKKAKDADGNEHVISDGIFSDDDLDKMARVYSAKVDPHNVTGWLDAQTPQQVRDAIKEEVLAEAFTLSADGQGLLRTTLDSTGKTLLDHALLADSNSFLGRLRGVAKALNLDIQGDGRFSTTLNTDFTPESLALMRQFQRGLRDYQDNLSLASNPGLPDVSIPITKIIANRALTEKYKDADFFAREATTTVTDPSGKAVERVLTPEQAMNAPTGDWVVKGGKATSAEDGSPAPDVISKTFAASPDGTRITTGTRIARNTDGTAKTLNKSAIEKLSIRRGKLIKDAIDGAPDDGTPNRLKDNGNGYYTGTMTPEQVARLKAIPDIILPPALKNKIALVNDLLRRRDGSRFVTEYQPALKGGKYRSLSPKITDMVPIGFSFSKAGNFLVTGISVSRLNAKLDAWVKNKPGRLDLWGGDKGAFWSDFSKYLGNHQKGEKGHIDLSHDDSVAMDKKDVLNDFLNLYDNATKDANSNRSTMKTPRGGDSPDRTVSSYRLDRMLSLAESYAEKLPIDYGKVKVNYLPKDEQMDSPDFYSNLRKVVDEKMPNSASPDQVRAIINPEKGSGVKSDEIKWSGVDDAIDNLAVNGKVSKKDLLDHLDNSGKVQFHETILGGSGEAPRALKDWVEANVRVAPSRPEDWMAVSEQLEKSAQHNQKKGNQTEANRFFDMSEAANRMAEGLDPETGSTNGQPKYAKWQLPGGTNYREMVLSMPEQGGTKYTDENVKPITAEDDSVAQHPNLFWYFKTPDNVLQIPKSKYPDEKDAKSYVIEQKQPEAPADQNYTSSHFDSIKNYVAHTRMNDRVDADGRPGTFIEELQSDRHQAGKKEGYKGDSNKYQIEESKDGGWDVKDSTGKVIADHDSKEAAEAWVKSYEDQDKKSGIPDAPFRKDWPIQLTKRVIRDAVTAGHDWVGWTNGETQSGRYDLSKQLSRVKIGPSTEDNMFTVMAWDKDGKRIANNDYVTPEKLPDFVGKDLAQKAIDDGAQEKDQSYSDLDLKVGGEGMKGFYDDILPKEIGKYIKKFGSKVEKVIIPTDIPDRGEQLPTQAEVDNSGGKEIWKFDITPEMRKAVSTKGQPLFKPNDDSNDLANDPQKAQDAGSERVQNKLFKANRSERPSGDQGGETGQFLARVTNDFKAGDGASEDAQGIKGETKRLVDLAKENGILLDKFPKILKRDDEEKDMGGAEHHVFKMGNRMVKVTRGTTPVGKDAFPAFGGWKLERGESPLGYLQRMELTNQVFDDDIRLHAVVKDKHGNVSIITSQPLYEGDRMATPEEAQNYMEKAGFTSLGNSGYYRASDNVAVLDLHEENAIMDGDKFIPFDGLVIHPSDEMKAQLIK